MLYQVLKNCHSFFGFRLPCAKIIPSYIQVVPPQTKIFSRQGDRHPTGVPFFSVLDYCESYPVPSIAKYFSPKKRA